MRVLFITNYYPPSNYGWGYMQLCEEVADGLVARGHDIAVLTSTRRDGPEVVRPYPVHRLLSIDPDWHAGETAARQFIIGRRRREREAVQALQDLVEEFRPDLLFVWHAIGLPRVLLEAAERAALTVYYLAGYLPELPDEYIAYWRAEPVGRLARLVKRPLARLAVAMLHTEGKPIRLHYENVICVSDYVRHRLVSQGLIPSRSVVIRNGVNLQHFRSGRGARTFSKGISLLYAGRLEPDKGVHVVLEALALLPQEQHERVRQVAIVGDGKQEYRSRLLELAEDTDLLAMVEFRPPASRSQMPALLDGFDVLVLPSSLEALPRMMQEAMAMGLLVIGTTTGGSGELLVHEQTGLAFEAGDPQSLASQLARVAAEPWLAAQLAQAGRAAVCGRFDIQDTVDQIEAYLQSIIDGVIPS